MATSLTMGPYTAIIAIVLAYLSSSAQGPVGDGRMYFPPVPQQPNYPAKKKTPAKRGDTAPRKSAPTPQDATIPQLNLLSTIDQSQFQPDPDSGLMKLDVVVTDQQGRSVAGLGEKDLTLLDNGQPRDIVTFQAFDGAASKPDPQVEVILVIDEVDLPAVLLSSVQQAAQKFLLQNGGHLAQPTMVYRISNDGLSASSQPSKDGNILAREVAERNEPRTIWNSMYLGRTLQKAVNENDSSYLLYASWTGLPHPLIALGSIAIEERRLQTQKAGGVGE